MNRYTSLYGLSGESEATATNVFLRESDSGAISGFCGVLCLVCGAILGFSGDLPLVCGATHTFSGEFQHKLDKCFLCESVV
ncbi:hypothetical protein [Lysinibacillus sp. FJAT-14745]|uniref:hypothetical protein n=1 Tax=Lysinibacillus sp. FJAT-14745 TaxID=1704289 RepID=UPI000A533313|nr:hypothetical protein [Lysinibacillus sp. FJAT-14745]